jgi:translation initiation factor IF-2
MPVGPAGRDQSAAAGPLPATGVLLHPALRRPGPAPRPCPPPDGAWDRPFAHAGARAGRAPPPGGGGGRGRGGGGRGAGRRAAVGASRAGELQLRRGAARPGRTAAPLPILPTASALPCTRGAPPGQGRLHMRGAARRRGKAQCARRGHQGHAQGCRHLSQVRRGGRGRRQGTRGQVRNRWWAVERAQRGGGRPADSEARGQHERLHGRGRGAPSNASRGGSSTAVFFLWPPASRCRQGRVGLRRFRGVQGRRGGPPPSIGGRPRAAFRRKSAAGRAASRGLFSCRRRPSLIRR